MPDDAGVNRIGKLFDPDKIDVRTRSMTVDHLLRRMRRGALDLAPEFRRSPRNWTMKNQSRLIESLILRIPLPNFYAAEAAEGQWSVVDGAQRLTTLARFVAPEILREEPLVLGDLEYLGYDGYSYKDLPPRLKTRLDETEFVVHLIGQQTPEGVKLNIFERINTGGPG